MSLAWIMTVAIALGTDAFSLSLVIGLTGVRKRFVLQLSSLIALFHVLMPFSGMVAGQALGTVLGRLAGGIGALVLVGLGVRILYKIYQPAAEYFPLSEARNIMLGRQSASKKIAIDGAGLYLLAASVSLDSLSVGFSLGTIKANMMITVLIIGLVAGLMTGMGLFLGRVIGTCLGDKVELVGGLALLLIGIKLLI